MNFFFKSLISGFRKNIFLNVGFFKLQLQLQFSLYQQGGMRKKEMKSFCSHTISKCVFKAESVCTGVYRHQVDVPANCRMPVICS